MGRVSYNGKPTAAMLPEFDFDNLPESLGATGPEPVTNSPESPQTEAVTADTVVGTDEPPASVQSTATANRGADIYSKDRTFDFQGHDWRQRGRELVCFTCPENAAHGSIVPAGKQLTGERGKWRFVAEGGHCVHGDLIKTCTKKHK